MSTINNENINYYGREILRRIKDNKTNLLNDFNDLLLNDVLFVFIDSLGKVGLIHPVRFAGREVPVFYSYENGTCVSDLGNQYLENININLFLINDDINNIGIIEQE